MNEDVMMEYNNAVQLLKQTDYVALKIAEGTDPIQYAEVLKLRQNCRNKINNWDGDEFIPPSLSELKQRKREEVAWARWNEMSSPTVVEGYPNAWFSDKESMNDMLRASTDLQTAITLGHLPEGTTLQWKTADGAFADINLNDLTTIRLLLSQRQQALYAKEAVLVLQISSATTPEDLELIEW